jgi:hypothetical protein
MRSWVYGASYGAASSLIVLAVASLVVPRGDVISDEPPAAQVNSEDLMSTADADSKAATLSVADSANPAATPVTKPAEPVTETTFNGLDIDIPAPQIAALDLSPEPAPGIEPPPAPLMMGHRGTDRILLPAALNLPDAEVALLFDDEKPPYYGANVIQPSGNLITERAPEPEVMPTPEPEAPAETVELAEGEPSGTILPRTESRLPQIGTEPVTAAPEPAPGDGASERSDALIANASAWADSGQPKLSVILVGVTPDFTLPALDEVPVAVIVDAMSENADSAIASVRGAGQEVVVATPLPEGAAASDVQVAFEAYAPKLAEAVAVIEAAEGGFRSREVAEAVVDLAAARGLGLVSMSEGLNPVRQLAGPAGAHAGLVGEDLGAVGSDAGALSRALDKAAFKAGQDGSVILVAPASPAVIAALKEWSASPRGRTVALAPLSAVLKGL